MIPPLFAHQERAVAAMELMPRLWLNASYGVGKTRMALEIIKRKKLRTLVIAPLTLIETSWRGDWERFGYRNDFSFANLRSGSIAFSCNEKTPESCLAIVNPELFIKHKSEGAPPWDTLIVDEASKLKNRSSKISKAVFEMSKRVKRVYLLSGNIAPNSEEEYFASIRCLDESLLGSSYYGFMGRYFYSTIGYAPGGRQFKKWTIRDDRKQELADKLKRVSIRIGKEDAPELPEQTFVVRSVELEPEQRRVYETLKKEWIVQFGGHDIVATNALAELSKLRQIASGFNYTADGVLSVGMAKMDTLRGTLEEIGNEQVVIFSVWKEEIRQIKEMLGEKAGCVYGEVSDGEKTDSIRAFQSGERQYLVAHPRSGGVGLNLQQASYCVWASLDYSLESWEQGNARIHRSGQTRPCTYTVLLAKDTIDEGIYAALQKKADVNKQLTDMMRN